MDTVFQALSHESRRRMLDIDKGMPGCSVNDVCKYFEISRIGVMKHLKILEAADLIISEKEGRTRELYFNAAPIQLIYDRWTTEYSAFWATHVTDIKFKAETRRRKRLRDDRAKRGGQRPHHRLSRHPAAPSRR